MLSWMIFKKFLFSKRSESIVRRVAIVSFLGIALGIFALVVILSVMNGLGKSTRDRFLSVDPHITATFKGYSSHEEVKSLKIFDELEQYKSTLEFFEKQDVIVRTQEGRVLAGVARGLPRKSVDKLLAEISKVQSNQSSSLFDNELSSESLGPNKVFFGFGLANSLGIFEGDEVNLIAPEGLLYPSGELPPYERVEVVGLVASNINDTDSSLILYSTDSGGLVNLLGSSSRELQVGLRIPNPDNIDKVQAIFDQHDIHSETWKQKNKSLFYSLKMEKIIVSILMALSTLIASFSMVMVLVLLISQRKKDISMFMTLGLSQKMTERLFLKVGMFLSFSGIFLGAGLGLLACFLIDRYSKGILPEFYQDSNIPTEIDPMQISLILCSSLVFSCFVCFLTSKKYSKMSPVDLFRK